MANEASDRIAGSLELGEEAPADIARGSGEEDEGFCLMMLSHRTLMASCGVALWERATCEV